MQETREPTAASPATSPATDASLQHLDEVQSASTGAVSAAAALVERWRGDLAGSGMRIALSDGEDPRCVAAALRLHDDGTVIPVLVGRPRMIEEVALSLGRKLPVGMAVMDPWAASEDRQYVDTLADLLGDRGPDEVQALATDPVYAAALMVRLGHADAAVAGATRTTAEVIRAALCVLGLAEGISVLSSCFIMVLSDGRTLGYGDCAVLPLPDEEQLADVAISTAKTYAELSGESPLVAMLSFSTKGSASHQSVDRVRRTVGIVHRKSPDLVVDGELQFDAAFVPAIGSSKAAGSAVAGRANVFVFPDLQAGNIAYKITERIGGAVAVGPVLQGLAYPLNDLSRGCSASDIATSALLVARQAAQRAQRGLLPLAGGSTTGSGREAP